MIYRIYSSRRSSYKPSQAFLGAFFSKKILYSNNLINSFRLFCQGSIFGNCKKIWPKFSFHKSQQNLLGLLPPQASIHEDFFLSLSQPQIPHSFEGFLHWPTPQKILYSNNLINPVSLFHTCDDLILELSYTRINTVHMREWGFSLARLF